MTSTATPDQLRQIAALCQERDVPTEGIDAILTDMRSGHVAHEWALSVLAALEDIPPVATITEGGYYMFGGVVCRVGPSLESGNLFAEALNEETGRFEYAHGLVVELAAEDKLSAEEARSLGLR